MSVRCYTVLDQSLWITGVLNDVFVSGLPDFVGLSVHSQWSLSFQYARALICRSCAYGRCFLFPECFSDKCPVLPFCSLSLKIPSPSSVNRIILNWYKFVVSALSSLLNGILHCQYIVTALKIIIYNNIVCFCLQLHRTCIYK